MGIHRRFFMNTIYRLLAFAGMLFLLSAAVFWLARLAPGDPLQSFYGDSLEMMTQAEQDAARERLGLNQGIHVQFGRWVQGVLQGDFGISLRYKMPALRVVIPLLGNTLILGGIAYLLVFALAVPLAALCARYEDELFDRIVCRIGTAAHFIPPFWLGVMLILFFSVRLGLLPSSGAYDIGKAADLADRARHLVLPLTVMVAGHLWYYACMIRNKLTEELGRDYVQLARSKGLTRGQIIRRHCLRNTAPAIVNIMAVSIPHITGGTVVAEAVFSYPGIGNLAVESAKYHDYNLLMLTVLITGGFVFISGFLAQAVNERIDPRMRDPEAAR